MKKKTFFLNSASASYAPQAVKIKQTAAINKIGTKFFISNPPLELSQSITLSFAHFFVRTFYNIIKVYAQKVTMRFKIY